MEARCYRCGGPFWRDRNGFYWCNTPACADEQLRYAIGFLHGGQTTLWYVPLPKQVLLETRVRPIASDGQSFNTLFAGAAGPGKGFSARRVMYRRALRFHGYEALILRKSYKELEQTHLRDMEREVLELQRHGVTVEFLRTDRLVKFPDTGALIQAGHLDDLADLEKYLSTNYDDIWVDEAAGFRPDVLLPVSTRARSTKLPILEAGGPWFTCVTNPGGPSSDLLQDFFITHTPDFDAFPTLRAIYDPRLWVYTEARLEDNPYLGPGYEAQLAVYDPDRYEQLRHANWDRRVGRFFSTWSPTKDGQPYHVRTVGLPTGADGHVAVDVVSALDWGRSSPGCVGWWALLPDGHVHRVCEWKFRDTDVPEVARYMRQLERDRGFRIRYRVADPAIFATGQGTAGGESIGEQFLQAGLVLRPGDHQRVFGWERVRTFLTPDATGVPWLTADPSCTYFIRTMGSAQQDPRDPEDTNAVDDHALDEARLFCMSRPAPTIHVPPPPAPGSVGAEVAELRAGLALPPRQWVRTR
jgi:Terminase large subunit, T4likevirus-type, N-terminal